MKVNINSVHFSADKKLEDFITEKVSKLKQYDENLISADVTLTLEKPKGRNFDSKVIKAKIKGKNYDLFAEKISETFETATDQLIDALKAQLKKRKEKLLKKK